MMKANQLWITLRVATDTIPLLTSLCSKACENKLPQPPQGYVQFPHKGGADLKQPTYEEWAAANVVKLTMADVEKLRQTNKSDKPKPLKLIRKIWEK